MTSLCYGVKVNFFHQSDAREARQTEPVVSSVRLTR